MNTAIISEIRNAITTPVVDRLLPVRSAAKPAKVCVEDLRQLRFIQKRLAAKPAGKYPARISEVVLVWKIRQQDAHAACLLQATWGEQLEVVGKLIATDETANGVPSPNANPSWAV